MAILQLLSLEDSHKFVEALRKLLQSMSSRMFSSYDTYYRSDMYQDDSQLYEYTHDHFIPGKISQYRTLTSLNGIPGYSFLLIVFCLVLVVIALFIGISTGIAVRILIVLPYVIMLPFIFLWFRNRKRELDIEIDLLHSIDEKFADLLQITDQG